MFTQRREDVKLTDFRVSSNYSILLWFFSLLNVRCRSFDTELPIRWICAENQHIRMKLEALRFATNTSFL